MSQFRRLGQIALLALVASNLGCGSNTSFKDANALVGEKLAVEVPPDDLTPPQTPPTTPPVTPPTLPPVTQPSPPATEIPDDPTPTTHQCGGANPNDYTGFSDLAKSQSSELFSSYASCSQARAAIFGNALVCSKAVSATILGCLQTANYQHAVMELTLALPILRSSGQMEVPYDYFLLGVPSCAIAAGYINSHMGASIPTAGQFTGTRAEVRASCLNTSDVLIRVLRIYQ